MKHPQKKTHKREARGFPGLRREILQGLQQDEGDDEIREFLNQSLLELDKHTEDSNER